MKGTGRKTGGLWLLLILAPVVHADQLSLNEAEQIAIESDPMLTGIQARSKALQEQSVADGQLPDPKLKMGLMNFPTDTYARDQEPMTQLQLGVSQMFPPGQTLKYKAKRTAYMGDAQSAHASDQLLKVRKSVRDSYLETFYWEQAGKVINKNQSLFSQLVEITRSRYAAGVQNLQDVVRAELELGLLQDRESRIHTMAARSRAELARWIGGEKADLELSGELPSLNANVELMSLRDGLENHPALQASAAQVSASQQGVAMAREAYKPAWMLDVTYADRQGSNMDGSDRANFLSAMVKVDIPLFTGKRQDRRLAASQHRANAAIQARDLRYRELTRQLDKTWADGERLAERKQRYEKMLLPQAHTNTEAALNAYQADRGDFTMLMRAHITELNTQLDAMRVAVDHARAQAGLMYLSGEDK